MITLSLALATLKSQILRYPVEIHDVYLGSQIAEDDDTLHFVTYYRQINFFTYLGQIAQSYLALSMRRSAIKKGSQGEIDRVSYKVDNVNLAMSAYANQFDFRNKRIVTRLVFRDHLDNVDNAKVIFDGLIQTIIFGEDTMEMACVPIISSLSFETGWPYQLNCAAKFGDDFCAVNKESASNTFSGTAKAGTTGYLKDQTDLTQADDYWNFGQIWFTSGSNNGYKRKVVDFASGFVYFDYALPYSVEVGDSYTIYRGCDKTLLMCQTTYSNDANYHGFNAIPLDIST